MEMKSKEEIRQIAIAEKKLIREVRREELTRIEEAARTEEDFEELIKNFWNKLDSNSRRRQREHEIKLKDGMTHDEITIERTIEDIVVADRAVIPQPLNHMWWKKMMHGDFLDTIFNCPYDLPELTSSKSISELVAGLRDNQKEVLYFRAICQWSPQEIAAMRGQTDRNIRKVYDTLIEGLRKKLYEWLLPRYEQNLPLTLAQREFMSTYKPKKGKTKKAARTDENKSEL